jgi:hypothetical protein
MGWHRELWDGPEYRGNRPQDYEAGRDPQLERAIEEIRVALAEHPPTLPDFGERPKLTVPGIAAPTDSESPKGAFGSRNET